MRVTYVLGPNINAPMSPDAGPKVQDALGRAQALRDGTKPSDGQSPIHPSDGSLLQIARLILGGEIAAKRKQTSRAIALLREAVVLEDQQNYDEPPSWYVSTRLVLGAIYLQARKPEAAERVYREDLLVFPSNGWALFGLAQALEAQGKRTQAAQVRVEFERAWTNADVELTASRFM